MITNYKVNFKSLPWELVMTGVRHKYLDQGGIRLRLVEYSKNMPAHWCEKGHYGYLIDGEMTIEFLNSKEKYLPGDGIFLPGGLEHKHMAKILSDKALVFFVEQKL